MADSRHYLAVFGGVGWLVGLWIAYAGQLAPGYWLALGAVAMAGAVVFWRQNRVGLALAAMAALALGGARIAQSQPAGDAGHIQSYAGSSGILITGLVAAEPAVEDDRQLLIVSAEEVLHNGRVAPVRGRLQVRAPRFPSVEYGTRIRLDGDLEEAAAAVSPGYARYLAGHGITVLMDYPLIATLASGQGNALLHALLSVKDHTRAVLEQLVPEPQAGLLVGILLGDDSGMSPDTREAFRATGMTHIIAISGFNIALLIALLDSVTGAVMPRRLAAALIIVALVLYTVLVGAAASVVRAAVMGIMYLIALRLMGRPTLAVASLLAAAVAMTLARPGLLWDVGFQLSFAATLGLMLYVTPGTRRLQTWFDQRIEPDLSRPASRLVSELVIVTMAAQVLVLPLILYHFGQLSLVSLPANILVLPAQPGVMFSGGATALVGLVSPELARPLAWIAWLFLAYSDGVVRLLASVPLALVPIQLSTAQLVVIYGLIAAASIIVLAGPSRRQAAVEQFQNRLRPAALAAAAVILVVLTVLWALNQPDGLLHVSFLDVGQGDAILLETPAGRQVLVDGGRYPSVLLERLGRRMPFWDRSIDLVVVTHPDADHVSGLVDVMARYEVGLLITNGALSSGGDAYAALLTAAVARGVPVHVARAGESIDLGDGAMLEVWHPGVEMPLASGDNDESVVIRLSYGQRAVLLTGDAEQPAEEMLLANGRPLASDVLKAGHHGANTSSSAAFLEAVSPQVVIISAGLDNVYGHPHPAVLERIAAVGAVTLRTDELGTIELMSDGLQMWWQSGD